MSTPLTRAQLLDRGFIAIEGSNRFLSHPSFPGIAFYPAVSLTEIERTGGLIRFTDFAANGEYTAFLQGGSYLPAMSTIGDTVPKRVWNHFSHHGKEYIASLGSLASEGVRNCTYSLQPKSTVSTPGASSGTNLAFIGYAGAIVPEGDVYGFLLAQEHLVGSWYSADGTSTTSPLSPGALNLDSWFDLHSATYVWQMKNYAGVDADVDKGTACQRIQWRSMVRSYMHASLELKLKESIAAYEARNRQGALRQMYPDVDVRNAVAEVYLDSVGALLDEYALTPATFRAAVAFVNGRSVNPFDAPGHAAPVSTRQFGALELSSTRAGTCPDGSSAISNHVFTARGLTSWQPGALETLPFIDDASSYPLAGKWGNIDTASALAATLLHHSGVVGMAVSTDQKPLSVSGAASSDDAVQIPASATRSRLIKCGGSTVAFYQELTQSIEQRLVGENTNVWAT